MYEVFEAVVAECHHALLFLRFLERLFVSDSRPVLGLQLLADLLDFAEDTQQIAT